MATVAEHYSTLLAPVYLWMVGGIDAALAQGTRDLAAFCDFPAGNRTLVDLGAGFGMHAIPLARDGWKVTAFDTSPHLLSALRQHGAGLAIRTVEDDLLRFHLHLDSRVDLAICLGDTLTHLDSEEDVKTLFSNVSRSLAPGGSFVLAFRDYSKPPAGTDRFIPVRSDSDRILTCFLEASETHVHVHDILHERDGECWRMRVSSYEKLRVDPDWVVRELESCGFAVKSRTLRRGMVWIVATGARMGS